ncbi:protein-lysine N-methyltransferase EEF2KMT [Battus philenor]|uniref:protein-lysine N-methyltransferase EEF2KMT n=1 Tax=Battus philenor TaxID=42288 RepID=UPI0035CEB3E0
MLQYTEMAELNKHIKTDVVQKLSKLFLSGNLKFDLTISEITELSWSNQEKLLQSTVNSDVFKKYPLRVDFCRLFFKKLLKHLEPHQEVHDGIFEFLCSLMKHKSEESNFCYRHYIFDDEFNNIITMKETNNMVVNGTTGMKTWEAALMLSDWILCNKELFHKKRVLELGSGVGFTGITLGMLCTPESITMTDCHNDVLKLLVENISINFQNLVKSETSQITCFRGEELNIDVQTLDWNYIEKANVKEKPDVIIGADIVYDPSILLPLCNVIQTFFKNNNCLEVYIASVIRNEETFEQFLGYLGKIDVEVKKLFPVGCIYITWDQEMPTCLLQIKKNVS